MKHYALLILLSIALAGCSSSLKASVGSTGNPEPAQTGSNMTAAK
ncbi:hypothetical protein [Chlorobium ferrooxidans]|nr:hypothetical protein [Chlorobium ferrooxidans]